MISNFIISNLLRKCVFLALFLIYLVFDIHLSPFMVYCSYILPAMCICTCACVVHACMWWFCWEEGAAC